MNEYTGWLLDIYSHPQRGIILWLLCDDGQRRCLYQDFSITFYAAGPSRRLRELWLFLDKQRLSITLSRTERRDLFAGSTIVLAARLDSPSDLPALFRKISTAFPDLTFYDADVNIALSHAAQYGTYPLARCYVAVDGQGVISELNVLDSKWELDPVPPPLRILIIEPDSDPFHSDPKTLLVRSEKSSSPIELKVDSTLLGFLGYLLKRDDPDLILTSHGDTWLLPALLKLSAEQNHPLPLNRDPDGQITYKRERSYFAYNQVVYRGQQIRLAGRLHIDIHNTVMYHDYGLDGVFEMARVTSLPIQTVARVSPGTGISAMQTVKAIEQEILVPLRKEQTERTKTTSELFRDDMGGTIYDPVIGLHSNVAEIDFASMYPSIMVRFNISPETVGTEKPTAELVPELGMIVDQSHPGLIPQTLAPLLEKRLKLKSQLAALSKQDCRYKPYKAYAAAHKWLTVTCFGYLGYVNARFGLIEAHEAVTAYGREVLLRAKEAAEDMGFRVLHMYVDGMWIKKSGCKTAQDFQPLLGNIQVRTNLSIALDGIYKWVAFLPSRQNKKIAVPNRYFGVFQNGEIKMRGIETRRHDTPAFIAEVQTEILEILAEASDSDNLVNCLPEIRALVCQKLADLRLGHVPLEKLVVRQTVSRNVDEYRVPSPASIAMRQLQEAGKSLRPGQSIRLIYTLGAPRARAWDLPNPLDPRNVDVGRYRRILFRSVDAVLEPIQGFSQSSTVTQDIQLAFEFA